MKEVLGVFLDLRERPLAALDSEQLLVIAGVSYALYDLNASRDQVDQMKARLKTMEPELKEANALIARTANAQRWTGTEHYLGRAACTAAR